MFTGLASIMNEFTLKAASVSANKKFSVFKSHKDDDVNWADAKMKRENEFQPWQIKFGSGRTSRRYKAIKEGGVGDNASYFILHKSSENSTQYEVCPVEDWFAVSATQRYKTLTAEEAEQKFEQRHKMLNFFSVMKLKKGENGESGETGADSRGFKVSELDDWDQSGEDDASGEDNGDADDDEGKKAKRKKNLKKPKDEDKEAPEEGKEDSDEGDFEQREVDYMSDSSSESDSDVDKTTKEVDVKGISEEGALRDFLTSDEEGDNDNPNQKSTEARNEKAIISDIKQEPDDSEDTSDSDDYDVDDEKMDTIFAKKELPMSLTRIKKDPEPPEPEPQVGTSNPNKRKAVTETHPVAQQPKKHCSDSPFEKMVEDLIVKYLTRKPMTLKNLLKEIKNKLKRVDWVTDEMDRGLVQTIADIIKRLQPDKEKINEVTYLSFRP